MRNNDNDFKHRSCEACNGSILIRNVEAKTEILHYVMIIVSTVIVDFERSGPNVPGKCNKSTIIEKIQTLINDFRKCPMRLQCFHCVCTIPKLNY